MPSTIRVLDDRTINQIAAGEVIENPASVVKELVENALDADATSISIEVAASGRHMIRVSDNGFGMHADDALLCFERHATSKVSKIEDLEELESMGFRGEALPSIASISQVRLMTRPHDQEQGTLVEIHGGKMITSASVPCAQGTSVEVNALFYNVPARKKFLKSIRQDLAEIQKVITQIAYGNPCVRFSFVTDKELVFDIPLVSVPQERAKQLLQESIYENMIPFTFREGDIHMEGLLGSPSLHRPNRTGQALFLNSRPVSSWEVAQGIAEGYGAALPERRFPLFHLHLTMSPHEFDVNVHPQKKEVRFCHLERLKEVLRKGVMNALCIKVQEVPYVMPEMPVWSVREPIVSEEFKKEVEIPLPLNYHLPLILGILPYYILLEEEKGVQVVDIQQARKRILFEEMHGKKGSVEKQLLFVPLKLQFTGEESALLIEALGKFEALGFEISPFGKNTFMIEALPSFIAEKEVESLLHEMLDGKEFEERMVARVKREKRILTKLEAEQLIQRLLNCQEPYFTPTGQPTLVHLSYEDLGKYFR